MLVIHIDRGRKILDMTKRKVLAYFIWAGYALGQADLPDTRYTLHKGKYRLNEHII